MADDAGELRRLLEETSFLYGGNAPFLEELHARWAADPNSVDPSWRSFFARLGDGVDDIKRAASAPGWGAANGAEALWPALEAKLRTTIAEKGRGAVSEDAVRAGALDSLRALQLIRAYRIRGHLKANLDPLGLASAAGDVSELDPATYGFADGDFDRPIFLDFVLGYETAALKDILAQLRRTYCGTLGFQYMHISDRAERAWLQARIEGADKEISFTAEGKIAILKKLIEAESFERFLAKRYPGAKRFGLDGAEPMVPALEQIIKRGGGAGVKDIVIGMPHRGRLNVLAAVMAKPYRVIFHEFQGGSDLPMDIEGSGDVKYHLGASSDRAFDGNNVHLSLTANPSHLEIVNPVVLGKARAKQAFALRANPSLGRSHVLPLLIHGDAAFSGQGVVAECFNISGVKGYRTGGTLHFILNNQIGFTTSPRYSRTSPYPSDTALMVEAPIIHANGDDPEAVVFAARIATDYRQQFGKDVVVDMFCYRRFGHNEGDDPTMTQPAMYRVIKDHPTTPQLYAQRLIEEGVCSAEDVDRWTNEFADFLGAEFDAGKSYAPDRADWLDGKWTGLELGEGEERHGETGVSMQKLEDLGRAITAIPEGFDAHRTVRRGYAHRREEILAGEGIDWSTAEQLAFASLLDQGFPVRLSGQDTVRGTFSQRHCELIDQTTEEHYTPLRHIRPGQAHFEVLDSALSEEAVLGFEYGFSLADPNTLTIWEAQFGDFANGAQVIIDQFISSAERKWLRMSGLTLLLPHGYEGQGPEHSSARLERYLQLCAEDNMQVANCSTPANYFHVLRRQLTRAFRKPLVLMTPKSLLRHKKAVSSLAEMADGSAFQRVLKDDAERGVHTSVGLKDDADIRRVILCSGKVYYDLLEEREKRGAGDIYLLRLEQFYPWPMKSISAELARFAKAELVWCQEEPKNMGGWTFVDPWLELTLSRLRVVAKRARYVGRPASASTAAGIMRRHLKELESFEAQAFA
ncbi:MAG TPA: 2-oxoglutarate dehydrogenase E1 component [Caulobacteraceae bacterium]|nr:2-oxoglutarate dehydrogenase E1 component [Caulobacteraceae bacterium]